MTELDKFDKALEKFEIKDRNTEVCEGSKKCIHNSTVVERGVVYCSDCGCEVERITEDQEWCNFGSEFKRTCDKNRVQKRKVEEKNIFKDVEGMDFSDSIVSIANKIFCESTSNCIVRRSRRKARVFACIYYAYKVEGNPQSHDKLLKIFGLDKKVALGGLNHVSRNSPKTASFRNVEVNLDHLTDEIMDKFRATPKQKKQVKELYNLLSASSEALNGSRPQSISSALVWYYICLKKLPISLEKFSKKVNLSELTIIKRAKEIAEIFKTPNIL